MQLCINKCPPCAGCVLQGLVSNLTLGAEVLSNWTVFSLSIDEVVKEGLLWDMVSEQDSESTHTAAPPTSLSLPTFYGGTLEIPDHIPDLPQDTYIQFSNWSKVCVCLITQC